MRLASALAGALVLCAVAGCGDKPTRPDRATGSVVPPPVAPNAAAAEAAAASARIQEACRQVREHRDEDYTAGGLYAPGVNDSAPTAALDLTGIAEPVPRAEPPSAFGNRTPYTVLGRTYRVLRSADGYVERGTASWYGQKFHGRQTSSREIYDMCSFSAAHKTLPLPSYVRVTRLDTGASVVVRVNDRGPFHEGRVIDLSYAAAVKLGLDRSGTAPVEVRALDGGALVAGGVAPGPVTASPPPSAPAPVATGSGPQLIQVGAYRDKDNARRIARQLEDAGLDDVSVEDVRVADGKVWRVRVGPLAAGAVGAAVARIRGLGLPAPRVFSE
jgi:rare lipoprotein A